MYWILVYNALFFFDFLFNRIVPNLYISNAGLGIQVLVFEKDYERAREILKTSFPEEVEG